MDNKIEINPKLEVTKVTIEYSGRVYYCTLDKLTIRPDGNGEFFMDISLRGDTYGPKVVQLPDFDLGV